MKSIFIDCSSLISLANISNWKYYNKNDINETPDYNKINGMVNLKFDFLFFYDSQEDYNITNNYEFMLEQKSDKFERLYK